MSSKLDRALTVLLVGASLVMTGILVRREFFAKPSVGATAPKAAYVADWRSILAVSRSSGDSGAPIVIAEFADLECPSCQRFHGAVKKVMEAYPGKVRHVFAHFPLAQHKHAMRAAKAAECANNVGRFERGLDILFDNQDSLSTGNWSWFGRLMGRDISIEISKCLSDSTSVPIIAAGRSLGDKFGVLGTPTVFINGWRYANVPAESEVVRAVGTLLSGHKPFADFPESEVEAVRRAFTR